MKPYFLEKQPEEEYRAADGINWSTEKIGVEKTPAHMVGQEPKDKQQFDLGKAVHAAILEFTMKGFKRGPENRRGKEWKEEYEICKAQGVTLLTASDYDSIARIRDAVYAKPDIARMLSSNNRMAEVSGYWERDGITCKCRWDLVLDDGQTIIDLKTTMDASLTGFGKSVANYGYAGQQYWYSHGAQQVFGEWPRFLFIAVEKDAPFESQIFELDAAAQAEGKAMAEAAFDLYRRCKETGEYPGYPQGIQQLNLPRWAFKYTGV